MISVLCMYFVFYFILLDLDGLGECVVVDDELQLFYMMTECYWPDICHGEGIG